jgi:hypothetical protein
VTDGRAHPLRAAAAARLTDVFAGYGRPATLGGCPHCVDASALGDLETLAVKLVTTAGDDVLLRHLLPALLDAAFGGAPRVHPAVVTSKLRRAGWLQWPLDEQAAVADYLEAAWLETLTTTPPAIDAGAALAAIAEAVDDLRPFLDDWQLVLAADGAQRLAALEQLLALIERFHVEIGAGRAGRILWSDRSEPAAQLTAWLTGESTRIQLDRATFDVETAALASRARAAIAVLGATVPEVAQPRI